MKLDINISRTYKLNLGDRTFSSIDLHSNLTLKDIEPSEYDKKYNIMSELMDGTIALETIKVVDEMKTMIPNISSALVNYTEMLKKSQKLIEQSILNKTKELN